MARLRRNGGIGQIEPREGTGNLVQPERTEGRGGSKTPMGTRLHKKENRDQRFETIRNGLRFVAYDPSPEARAARRRKYKLAWAALDAAEQMYGKRPTTIRGLPGAEAVRKRRPAGTQERGAPAGPVTGTGGRSTGSRAAAPAA